MTKDNFTQLIGVDKVFIDKIKDSLSTDAGKEFISKMEYKMQYEPAMANELVLSEFDNDDGIYLVRCYDHEFILGCHIRDKYEEEFYAMTFAEAMNVNLKTCNFIDKNITMIDWLINRDFKGVRYNHNYDLM